MATKTVERVEQEDLVMFINACFACTRQQEFYSDQRGQEVSIEFLHAYILGNYRRLYARTLAAGINHFNQSVIILNLLSAGSPPSPQGRKEEGELIYRALKRLPTNRAFQILREIQRRRVNNRRTRAIIRRYLLERQDLAFHAVKYRRAFRQAVTHGHIRLEAELSRFLFEVKKVRHFHTPLFESFRRAHYEAAALYDLPYTVAEGLAARLGVPRHEFLRGIQGRMTAGERFRLQRSAQDREGVRLEVDLAHMGLTRLAIYLLSLAEEDRRQRLDELDHLMTASAQRVLASAPFRLGRVAAVLDGSASSWGSNAKRRRPLAVALAASYLLKEASHQYRAFWTRPLDHELLVFPRGQTGLAGPLLDALEGEPELIVIVSDGFENDPPRGAAEVARVYREQLDPDRRVEIIHMNPVFDAESYAPRTIGPAIPTVGLRDAEDIPTMLGFARFASGTAPLSELQTYLAGRVKGMLEGP